MGQLYYLNTRREVVSSGDRLPVDLDRRVEAVLARLAAGDLEATRRLLVDVGRVGRLRP